MEHFDQLIKEKVESQHFDYQASTWKTFCKKAGISRISLPAKIAIIAAATTFVVATSLIILHFTSSQDDSANSLNINDLEVIPSVAVVDTFQEIGEEVIPMVAQTQTEKVSEAAPKVSTREEIQETAPTIIQDSTQHTENQEVKPVREQNKKQQWKISIINVDTIR